MNSASAFRLGDRFIQSLHDWKVNAQPSLIRILVETCARICLGVPKNEVTAFRGEPTRDDGANAFRTHLTKRGIAYRLMLWELPDKTYEFANVGGKSELIIY